MSNQATYSQVVRTNGHTAVSNLQNASWIDCDACGTRDGTHYDEAAFLYMGRWGASNLLYGVDNHP